MFRQRLKSMAVGSLAAAALFFMPAISAAQRGGHGGGGHGGGHPGGGHAGGFSHGGGVHPGGFNHGGFNHGGFHHDGFHHGNAYFFGYGLGYYPGFYGGYGYGYPYYDPWYYGYGRPYYYPYYYNDYGPDYYYPPPAMYNPALRGYPQPAATYAHISVRVPTDAQLWFEGEKTAQKGTSRQFDSPSLTPGQEYTYEIKAQWREGDQDVTQTRTVVLRAGEQVNVDFTKPPAPPEPREKVTTASS